MNRRQRERVEELNAAFQNELRSIMEDDPATTLNVPTERLEPIPDENMGVAPYNVDIRQVANGFSVNVGCQTFVFEKFETASKYMEMYFAEPHETLRKFHKGELFKD
jgi:hypothetical protein